MNDSTRPRADRVRSQERAAAAKPAAAGDEAGGQHGREATELVGSTLVDRYEIIERMGRGGMGVVYLAHDRTLQREVAVKVLRRAPETADRTLERFTREAQAAAALNDPHVVGILDFGQTASGEPYLVMERLVGQDLRSVVIAAGALPADRAARIAAQVLRALRATHGRGIVHRDLKSDNIFLTTVHGREHVKLIDFGISKLLEPLDGEGEEGALTVTGAIMGTPHYISPEQAHGDASVDERADLYSLGVVLYEMLTGQLPFRGASAVELMMQHTKQRPVAPSKRRPDLDIPKALERIVLRALEKSPARRFASASVMLGALEATGLLPAANKDDALPATRPTGRRRGSFALLGLLVLGMVVALALWTRRSVAPRRSSDAALRSSVARDLARTKSGEATPARDATPARARADAAVGHPAPAKIKLVVRAPAGAHVFIGPRFVGSGRVETHLPHSKRALRVRVRAPGYRRWQRSIVPDRNRTLPVRLVPASGSADLERNPHRPGAR